MSKEYVEIMVDVETTGTKPGAGIWQIGAVAVRECGNREREIELTINPRSLITHGFLFDGATEVWQGTTNKQNWHIAHTYAIDPNGPENLLTEFLDWCFVINDAAKVRGIPVRYWSKGNFDYPIIQEAAHILELPDSMIPWKYRQLNDLRTLCNVMERPVPKFAGAHNALEDASHQMEHLLALLRTLKGI